MKKKIGILFSLWLLPFIFVESTNSTKRCEINKVDKVEFKRRLKKKRRSQNKKISDTNELPDFLDQFGKLEKIGKGLQGTVFKSSCFESIVIKRIKSKKEVEIANKFISNDMDNLAKNCKFLMRVHKILKNKKSELENYAVYGRISGLPLYLDDGLDWISQNNCQKIAINIFLDWCKGLFGALKIFYQVTGDHLIDVKGYNIIMKPIKDNSFQPVIIDYGKIAGKNCSNNRGLRDLSNTLLIFFKKNLIDSNNKKLYDNLRLLLLDITNEKIDYDGILLKLENM